MFIKSIFLELFLRNLILNESNPLHNRALHISGAFKETEKPDIEMTKPDIEVLKPDIKTSRASDLLKEMAEHGIIEAMGFSICSVRAKS